MKTIATILAVSAVLAVVSASGGYGGSSGGYGGASIPSPPCPKNYVFSCQGNVAPAPCSQVSSGYGSAGAYSENVPTVVNSPYGYQGVPLQQFPQFYAQNFAQY